MEFRKYHGLGNDYLVLDPATAGPLPTPAAIRALCRRHFGIGSDGILWGPVPPAEAAPSSALSATASFGVRIFNPDGSEAEKSGNGLRIFARYLWECGRVHAERFEVMTLGGVVHCRVHAHGRMVTVGLGRASFLSTDIPVTGPAREVVGERLTVGGETLTFCAVTVGNPHCVVVRDSVSAADAQRLGPLLECAPRFPRRTNVQFVRVLDRANIRIEIWERGAGYTLASGSSASASAVAARRLGLCDAEVTVHMPGGRLRVCLAPDDAVTLCGPVAAVARGEVAPELLAPAET